MGKNVEAILFGLENDAISGTGKTVDSSACVNRGERRFP